MLIRIKSVKSETGERSNATVYSNIREGLFPKAVQIGKRSVGWPDYEVKAICAARIAGKTNAEIKELVRYLHGRRAELLNELLTAIPAASAIAGHPSSGSHASRQDETKLTRNPVNKTGDAA